MLFGVERFDRVFLSYSLSMIPDWQSALAEAARHLAPGGKLYVVDFGTQSKLPKWFRFGLRAWLGKFHVTPRDDLGPTLARIADAIGGHAWSRELFRGYAHYGVLIRPVLKPSART